MLRIGMTFQYKPVCADGYGGLADGGDEVSVSGSVGRIDNDR